MGMKIIEWTGGNTQSSGAGINQAIDTESKNYQNQIASAQSQLQKLSADSEMSPEEKAQKRQEIQKQILELKNELRQHQLELRRKQRENGRGTEVSVEQQQTKSSGAELLKEQTAGVPSKSTKAMISADMALERTQEQEKVFTDLEGRVRVLESEIKLDAGRGGKTEAKKSELASLEDKITKASGAKMSILNNAVQDMKQTVIEEEQTDSQIGSVEKKISKEMAPSSVFAPKNKTDAYTKGKMFSNVDIHI